MPKLRVGMPPKIQIHVLSGCFLLWLIYTERLGFQVVAGHGISPCPAPAAAPAILAIAAFALIAVDIANLLQVSRIVPNILKIKTISAQITGLDI